MTEEECSDALQKMRYRLVAYAYKTLRNEDAEDVVQKASLRIFARREEFKGNEEDFAAWTMTFVKYCCLNEIRVRNRKPIDYVPQVEDTIIDVQEKEGRGLESLLEKVTDKKDREILELVSQGYRLDQVAKKLGLARQTVYNRFNKIKKACSSMVRAGDS